MKLQYSPLHSMLPFSHILLLENALDDYITLKSFISLSRAIGGCSLTVAASALALIKDLVKVLTESVGGNLIMINNKSNNDKAIITDIFFIFPKLVQGGIHYMRTQHIRHSWCNEKCEWLLLTAFLQHCAALPLFSHR